MIVVPTLAALAAAFPETSDAERRAARKLMRGEVSPLEYDSACAWYDACWHKPDEDDPYLILTALNEVLGGYGVETTTVPRDDDGDAVLTYVNMGDTYAATLAFDDYEGEYLLTSWGAWVENEEAKGWVTK